MIYFPTKPLELATPFGKRVDFELSKILTDSAELAASTMTRAVNGNDRQPEFFSTLLREQFTRARFGRWQQNSLGGIRRVFQPFVTAMHADEHLDFIVIGRDVVVANWPVETESITGARFEII